MNISIETIEEGDMHGACIILDIIPATITIITRQHGIDIDHIIVDIVSHIEDVIMIR